MRVPYLVSTSHYCTDLVTIHERAPLYILLEIRSLDKWVYGDHAAVSTAH